MLSFFRKIIKKIFSKPQKWQDIEYFDARWKQRIALMAGFIAENKTVLDLGCGKMWLQEFLPKNCTYLPVDYVARTENTIVCDFNRHEFPVQKADIAFVSGCLEYVVDAKWFIQKITNQVDSCIISYCTTDFFPNIAEREERTWVNHFSEKEVIALFEENGFGMKNKIMTDTNNQIFVFANLS